MSDNTTRISITVSPEVRAVAPQFVGGALTCSTPLASAESPEALWQLIAEETEVLSQECDVLSLRDRKGICETRQTYKQAGLDPSRYRPSCEQLARRLLQGKDLFRVGLAVDLGNLVSLRCGCSIGVMDADKVEGEHVVLGLGRDDEPYEGIGRGQLHIFHMPVYRDDIGGFATPTSDSMRTRITESTRRLLILVNGYHGDKASVEETLYYTADLLQRFAKAQDINTWLF